MNVLTKLGVLDAVQLQPERLTDIESWHRHIPFAFALLHMLRPEALVELGTHKGDSYSAFCQGVVHLGLPTRCFAVDTWAGDGHAGAYGSDVLDELARWHDPRYASFSSLLRMTFDEALPQFSDASIDLLHIDGLHTYEAVKHDFESWLPRLSDRAVVLFHDTNVRHENFGVWKLWHELTGTYPGFEFPFGFGLGVLAVGNKVPQPVLDFIEHARNNSRQVVDFFYRQGDAAEVRKRSGDIIGLLQRIEGQGKQLTHALELLDERDVQNQQLQQDLSALQGGRDGSQELLLAERERLLLEREALAATVVRSRGWRIRNKMMRLLGQSHRVIEF